MMRTPVSADSLFATLSGTVQSWSADLIALSRSLHAEPELAWQEHASAEKVAVLAERAGFEVQRGVAGMTTALIGEQGEEGGLPIALCIEYDALPEIGHGCGHNVNAASALGAAIALGAVAEELGLRVKLIGTPAEEESGGKVDLIEAGAFDDVAVAAMVHAGGEDSYGGSSLAVSRWRVEYAGRPAHAALAPWAAVNALDAFTTAYTAIGVLRQQLPPGVVVSAVILEGGRAANVIPDLAVGEVEVRAASSQVLRETQDRVRACLEAGALASGAQLTVKQASHDFAELRQDVVLSAAYAAGIRRIGREAVDLAGEPIASTDMGNVSHLVPAIHPTIGYDVGGAVHHTAEFAERSASASADRAVVDGALALAFALATTASDPEQRQRLVDGQRSRGARRLPK
ncbi:M20 family peptidase [Leucobacter zeae]|nr:M20 family peptidase [Leucobacter zeae]